MIRVLCFFLMVSAAFSLSARMYVWKNPETGSVQASGTPPSWYRGEHGGPRVQVFVNGKLVDDTAITLPPSPREFTRSGVS